MNYYDENGQEFFDGTVDTDMSSHYDEFLALIPENGSILDAGCGSGRDTLKFKTLGYDVTAIDGSEKMCELASGHSGVKVKHMQFQEIDFDNEFDGIWASASLLHVSSEELEDVLKRLKKSLKDNGIFYASFKLGDFEGERNGRYFTDFTIETFESFIEDIRELVIKEHWITGDVRPGREDEKWLNLILQKTSF